MRPRLSRTMAALAAALLTAPGVAAAQTAGDVVEALPPPTGLAPYFVPATSGPKAPDADGFLQRWLLLEPISKPNRTNTLFTASYVRAALAPATYPGRFAALPRDGEVAAAPGSPRWHALDATGFDVRLFNLAQGLGKPTYGVIFWAATVVDSPREMTVRLAAGSNSASRWWLNGTEVVGLFDDRRMVMDDVVSRPLTLHKGRNILRGAVINGPGMSDFCVRFLDETGRPIHDITTSVK